MDKKSSKDKKKISKKKIKQPVKPQKHTVAGDEQIVSLIDKAKRKTQNTKTKNKVYYSFLTIVLIICLLQIGFGAILNISKTVSYRNKIKTMEKTRKKAQKINTELKQEVSNFSSTTNLEEIVRNNLKMAKEDEYLVIINSQQQEQPIKDKKKNDKK